MMNDRLPAVYAANYSQVVLDRIRPTVVVRRRAGEASASLALVEGEPDVQPHHPVTVAIALDAPLPSQSPSFPGTRGSGVDVEGDDDIDMATNVDEAELDAEGDDGASLEELPSDVDPEQDADIERPAASPASTLAPEILGAVRRVPVGSTIPIPKLAAAMRRPVNEVASELVVRGFFEITPRSIVSRDVARVAAEAFGWCVREVADPTPMPRPRRKPARSVKRVAKPVPAPLRKGGVKTGIARGRARDAG